MTGRRGRRPIVILVVVIALLGSACALVLGIEDKPLRPDTVEAEPPDAGVEATVTCEDPPHVCACVRHDFCDDFDVPDAAVFAAWKDDSGTPNQVTVGTATSTIVPEGRSLPNALQANATKTTYLTPTAAVGLTRLDFDALHPGRRFAGIKLGFQLRLVNIAIPKPDNPDRDAGPIPTFGCGGLGGLVGSDQLNGQPAGFGLVVANDRIYVAISSTLFAGNVADDYALVYDSPIGALANTWISVEILVAARDKAVALGYSECASLPDGPVGAATIIGPFRKCLPLQGVLAKAYPAWAKLAGVSVGGIAFDLGTMTVDYDDVVADYILE